MLSPKIRQKISATITEVVNLIQKITPLELVGHQVIAAKKACYLSLHIKRALVE